MEQNVEYLKEQMCAEVGDGFTKYISNLKWNSLNTFNELIRQLLDPTIVRASGLTDKQTWILRKRFGLLDQEVQTYEQIGIDIANQRFFELKKNEYDDGCSIYIDEQCVISGKCVKRMIKKSCYDILNELTRRMTVLDTEGKSKCYISLNDPVGKLLLSRRCTRLLKLAGIKTVSCLSLSSIDELRKIDGIGEKTIQDIIYKLKQFGFWKDAEQDEIKPNTVHHTKVKVYKKG